MHLEHISRCAALDTIIMAKNITIVLLAIVAVK